MNEYQDVEFVETEFRPHGVRKAYPGIHMLARNDTEMEVVNSDRRRRLVKTSRLADDSIIAEKSRADDRSRVSNDKERLIKTRSGVATKLRTLDEEVESEDLEKGLVDIAGHKTDVKEIV